MATTTGGGQRGQTFALGLFLVLVWNFLVWSSFTWASAGSSFLAFLASPLWFFVSGYIIRKRAQSIEDARQAAAAARIAEAEAQQRRLDDERLAEIERVDAGARQKIHRAELLNKLGLVTDTLGLLDDPANAEHKILLLQNITTELREVIAKHPLSQLVALIANDTVVQGKLDETFQRLAQHGYFGEEAAVLYDAALEARRS